MNDSKKWRNKKKSLSNKRSDVWQNRERQKEKESDCLTSWLTDWLTRPPSTYRILGCIWIRNRTATPLLLLRWLVAANEFQSIDICRTVHSNSEDHSNCYRVTQQFASSARTHTFLRTLSLLPALNPGARGDLYRLPPPTLPAVIYSMPLLTNCKCKSPREKIGKTGRPSGQSNAITKQRQFSSQLGWWVVN